MSNIKTGVDYKVYSALTRPTTKEDLKETSCTSFNDGSSFEEDDVTAIGDDVKKSIITVRNFDDLGGDFISDSGKEGFTLIKSNSTNRKKIYIILHDIIDDTFTIYPVQVKSFSRTVESKTAIKYSVKFALNEEPEEGVSLT